MLKEKEISLISKKLKEQETKIKSKEATIEVEEKEIDKHQLPEIVV